MAEVPGSSFPAVPTEAGSGIYGQAVTAGRFRWLETKICGLRWPAQKSRRPRGVAGLCEPIVGPLCVRTDP